MPENTEIKCKPTGMVGTKFYNCWRAFRFTIKGRNIGCSQSWESFDNFYHDMFSSYEVHKKLVRRDKTKPFCLENCFWTDSRGLALSKNNLVKIEYNGKSLTIKEWATELGVSPEGIRIRYYLSSHLSVEEILLGVRPKPRRYWKEEDKIKTRASKLLSTYKTRDSLKGMEFNVEKQWFIENILSKECFYCRSTDRIGGDRIDNSIGHIMGNLVPCCHICNGIRGDHFSVSEMKQIGIVIQKIKEQRNETFKVSIARRSN